MTTALIGFPNNLTLYTIDTSELKTINIINELILYHYLFLFQYCLLILRKGAHSVAPDGLKLAAIFLSQPKHWDVGVSHHFSITVQAVP